MIRIGHGFDVHAFAHNRKLVLGGVHIPYELGLFGHSDADVVLHSLCDALLGAARIEGAQDIGELFPDNNPAYKGADSLLLLKRVAILIEEHGMRILDCDTTIAAEAPKIHPYRNQMRDNISKCLGLDSSHVGVKATTTEQLGFVGRKEGIAAWSVAVLKTDDKNF